MSMLMLLCSSGISVFATEGVSSTPLKATIEGSSYDFTITESIGINVAKNTNDASTVSNLVLTNNSKKGIISETLNLENASPCQAKAYNTEWKNVAVNSKYYGLKADDKVDLFTTVGSTGYLVTDSIGTEESNTTTFKARVPSQATAVSNASAGYVVVTVAWTGVAGPPTFTICACDYTDMSYSSAADFGTFEYEKGMTWGQWVDSDYNTAGYKIINYSICTSKSGKVGLDNAGNLICLSENESTTSVGTTDLIEESLKWAKEYYGFDHLSLVVNDCF